MKVILMKDIAQVGRRFDVKDVPTGHAMNFLLPRKLAVSATPENLKRVEESKKKQSEQKEEVRMSFKDACEALAGRTVSFKAEASEQGHLFKGIKADDVSRRLAEEGISMPKEYIVLAHPIKEVGTHSILLRHDGVEGACSLDVSKK